MEFLYTVVCSVDRILNPSPINCILTTNLLHLLFYISVYFILNIYGSFRMKCEGLSLWLVADNDDTYWAQLISLHYTDMAKMALLILGLVSLS